MPSRHHAITSEEVPRTSPWWLGLVVGAGSLAALTLLKLAFLDTLGTPTPFLLYFAAVLAAAWYGGKWAGLLTTLAAALCANLLFQAPHFGLAFTLGDLVRTSTFALEGIAIVAMTVRLREERLRHLRAAQEARQSAQKLSAVLTGMGEGVVMRDANGTLLYVNETGAKLSGFPTAQAMLEASNEALMNAFEVFDEDGAPLRPGELAKRAAEQGFEGPPVKVRFVSRSTGAERWSIVRSYGTYDAAGALQLVVHVFQDVTASHRHAEEMHLMQERLATAMRSIGDAVMTTDSSGIVTFINPIAEQLTCTSAAEAVGRPLRDVFPIFDEKTERPVESPVTKVLSSGKVIGFANHTVLRRPDGTLLPIDDSAAPIKTAAGKVEGVVLVFRDVSQQRGRRARTNFLMQAATQLNSSLDSRKTLASVARLAVPAIADFCAIDLRNGDDLERLAVTPEGLSTIDAASVGRVLRTGKPERAEELTDAMLASSDLDAEQRDFLRRLGARSSLAVPIMRRSVAIGVITLIRSDAGRRYDEDDLATAVALADLVSISIANSRLFEEADRLRADAELANRSKDEFLAILGHELRNPLAPILTALQLMNLRSNGALARERSIIERQVQHVVRLVDDLLDVTRITRGKVALAREPVDAAEIVARALELASPLLEQRHHHYEADLEPRLFIDADPTRMAQVISNVLNNAAKYTEPGGRISTRVRRDGQSVVISVKDNGIGVAPEMLPRLFDSFVQDRQPLDRAQGGLGLGLAIAKRLVTLHEGTIEALSDGQGRGMEVNIRLPEVAAPSEREQELDATEPSSAGCGKVLVVDDNADALETLAEGLEQAGYQTIRALDGPTALSLAEREHPNVALVDIGLPVMDGFELARKLRGIEGLQALKLVALTGYGQPNDRTRSASAGFDEHLVKPVSLETIEATLKRLSAHH